MKKQWDVKFDGRGLGSGEIISTIFDKRGIDDFSHFLNPNEDDLIPLGRLHNIDKAFEIIDEGLIMGYKFEVPPEKMKYDIQVSDADDFDLK